MTLAIAFTYAETVGSVRAQIALHDCGIQDAAATLANIRAALPAASDACSLASRNHAPAFEAGRGITGGAL